MQTAIRITAVQLLGGVAHQHIVALRWASEDDDATGDSTVPELINWLRDGPHVAWVGGRNQRATLHIARDADFTWLQASRVTGLSRDLLDLPRRSLLPQPDALLK